MPLKISKAVLDSHIREKIFDALDISNIEGFKPINARQWGCLVVDDEGNQRYARVGVIVAEMREDMTAAELMQSEVDKYEAAQEKKRKQAAERKIKAERDKAKREAAAKEKEGE
jgi:hypothetical protein